MSQSEDGDKGLFVDRTTLLDRIEDRADERGTRRPLRSSFEKTTDKIPQGPLGKLGDGVLVGYTGYVATRTGQLAVLPIPGVRQPGFHVISHGVKEFNEFERHTVNISAASRQVAQVVAEYHVAAPSNIDFLTGEVETVSIEQKKERGTFSTWEIVVDVADRGTKEE